MCPLCHSQSIHHLATIDAKPYWQCDICDLAFLSPEHHLSPDAELAQYLLHENSPDDPRYRAFLSRLTDYLVPNLSLGAEGLDYGAGPGPTLSVMLEEQGFHMNIYDPYFAPNTDVLNRTYHFIVSTETFEHFYYPAKEFLRFNQLLRYGGWLGVMTEMLESEADFADWWYHREPTHVCFYKRETMAWIARRYAWEVAFPRKNVTLFHKPERQDS
jgi:hypothetical protein